MADAYGRAAWNKPFIDKTTTKMKEIYLMHFWNLSVSNHLLLSLSALYKTLYKQKSLENVTHFRPMSLLSINQVNGFY